jgi:hypothetical protein
MKYRVNCTTNQILGIFSADIELEFGSEDDQLIKDVINQQIMDFNLKIDGHPITVREIVMVAFIE